MNYHATTTYEPSTTPLGRDTNDINSIMDKTNNTTPLSAIKSQLQLIHTQLLQHPNPDIDLNSGICAQLNQLNQELIDLALEFEFLQNYSKSQQDQLNNQRELDLQRREFILKTKAHEQQVEMDKKLLEIEHRELQLQKQELALLTSTHTHASQQQSQLQQRSSDLFIQKHHENTETCEKGTEMIQNDTNQRPDNNLATKQYSTMMIDFRSNKSNDVNIFHTNYINYNVMMLNNNISPNNNDTTNNNYHTTGKTVPTDNNNNTNTPLLTINQSHEIPFRNTPLLPSATLSELENTMNSKFDHISGQFDQVYQFFSQLHDDYNAVKYLMDKNIIAQTEFNSKCREITNFDQKLCSIEKLQEIIANNKEFIRSEIKTIKDEERRSLDAQNDENDRQKRQKDQEEADRVQKHSQLELRISQILDSNVYAMKERLTMNKLDSIYVCFEFENLPNLVSTCSAWGDWCLDVVFYRWLALYNLPKQLKGLMDRIKKSKLFISSQSVLNGDWIQIQGDCAMLDMKTTTLYSFIKYGDNNTPFTRCNQYCGYCSGKGLSDIRTPRFLIRFKWEYYQ
jgi:hypothetical protein